jgi:hypothetical protein
MRRLQPRLRLRTMMLVVAAVAVAIGVDSMRRRRNDHLDQASRFALGERTLSALANRKDAEAAGFRMKADELEDKARGSSGPDLSTLKVDYNGNAALYRLLAYLRKEAAADDRKQATERYGRVRRLHEYAASHPWLSFKVERFPF